MKDKDAFRFSNLVTMTDFELKQIKEKLQDELYELQRNKFSKVANILFLQKEIDNWKKKEVEGLQDG